MEEKKFSDMYLSPGLLNDLKTCGFVSPMPIQAEAIPPLLEGRDLIGQAKTGTGKTLAFAIPIIEGVAPETREVSALILTPTRELAEQVAGEFHKVTNAKRLRVAAFYGGKSIEPQARMLERGVHIVVGTPGRILDLIERRILRLSHVKFMVLDEADRMLDMGFIDDVRKIIRHIPDNRQTMLFSATMPDAIANLARGIMKDPYTIKVSADELTVDMIDQCYYEVSQNSKFEAFIDIVKEERPESAIVFCNTKRWAETMKNLMRKRGLRAEAIHGDLTQKQRDYVIDGFRNKKFRFMVATDVAARGLDIDHVSHVFNYDLPKEKENYVHRIGRTGRAGKSGKAISFITPKEIHDLWGIEHVCRTKIRWANER